jgi:hypothetical protein
MNANLPPNNLAISWFIEAAKLQTKRIGLIDQKVAAKSAPDCTKHSQHGKMVHRVSKQPKSIGRQFWTVGDVSL